MSKSVPSMRLIESYSLGSLADGSVILHFLLPRDPVPSALRFDGEALDDFLEKVADARREALKRKAAAIVASTTEMPASKPDMPLTELTSEYYRGEAERNRKLANHAKGVFQSQLLKLAAEYEDLAKETEDPSSRRTPA